MRHLLNIEDYISLVEEIGLFCTEIINRLTVKRVSYNIVNCTRIVQDIHILSEYRTKKNMIGFSANNPAGM